MTEDNQKPMKPPGIGAMLQNVMGGGDADPSKLTLRGPAAEEIAQEYLQVRGYDIENVTVTFEFEASLPDRTTAETFTAAEMLDANADNGDEADGEPDRDRESAAVIGAERDGDYWVLPLENGNRRLITPKVREYHVLYLTAWSQNRRDRRVSCDQIGADADEYLTQNQAQAALSRLRETPLVDYERRGRSYHYGVTDEGVEYLQEHGLPTKYDVPDDAKPNPDAE